MEGLIEMVVSQVAPELTRASTGWEERAPQDKGIAPQRPVAWAWCVGGTELMATRAGDRCGDGGLELGF